MKHFFILVSVSFLIFLLSGCGSKSNVEKRGFGYSSVEKRFVGEKNTTSKKTTVSRELSYNKKFTKALNYRNKLAAKGMKYSIWKTHLDDDIILMKRINTNLRKNELRNYNISGYRFVLTRKNSFIGNKDRVIFVNYKSNVSSLKSFLKKNRNKLYRKTVKKKTYSKKIVPNRKIDKKSIVPNRNISKKSTRSISRKREVTIGDAYILQLKK